MRKAILACIGAAMLAMTSGCLIWEDYDDYDDFAGAPSHASSHAAPTESAR